MKTIKLAAALLCALVLLAGAAYSQDEVMVIKSEILGPHQRPLVVFSHGTHSANIECQTCHHDFDQYFNLKSSEGLLCSECHKAGATPENAVPLVMAMHKQCKHCHLRHTAKSKQASPIMCGDCHVRGAAQKILAEKNKQ